MNELLQLAELLASMVILTTSCGIILRMTSKTNHTIRFIYTLIATGAFGLVISIPLGYLPDYREALLLVGFAALSIYDRRGEIRCPLIQVQLPEGCPAKVNTPSREFDRCQSIINIVETRNDIR